MNRRRLLVGLGALIAAPAVIRTPGLLMPVRPIADEWVTVITRGTFTTAIFHANLAQISQEIAKMQATMGEACLVSTVRVDERNPDWRWQRILERHSAARAAA